MTPDKRVKETPCKHPRPRDKRMRPPSAAVRLQADVREPAECAPQHRPAAHPEQPREFVNRRRHMVCEECHGQNAAAADKDAQPPRAAAVSFSGKEVLARENAARDKHDQDDDPIQQFADFESPGAPRPRRLEASRSPYSALPSASRVTILMRVGSCAGSSAVTTRNRLAGIKKRGTLAIGEAYTVVSFGSPPPERTVPSR